MDVCIECCGSCAGAAYHAAKDVVKAVRPESFGEMSLAQKDAWFNQKYAECKRLREQGYEPEVAYYFQYQWKRSAEGVAYAKKYNKSYKKTAKGWENRQKAAKKYKSSEKGKAARRAAYARKKEKLNKNV